MVGPLAFGFIKRLHPYKNLYDLEFLKSKNCIYAVTNPIFKSKKNDWDILCEVETGKVAISAEYERKSNQINKESDKMFKQESLGWGDIKLSFLAGFILGIKLGILHIFLGSILALPYALYVTIRKKDKILPFGPFLSAAILIIFWTSPMLRDIINILLGGKV